jgi:ankyrin repeat protein
MVALESDDESEWTVDVPADLWYAVNYWGKHAKLSANTLKEFLDDILEIFTPDSTMLEKWWIMFKNFKHGTSQDETVLRHHTTPLHILAFFDLCELLKAPQRVIESGHRQLLAPILAITNVRKNAKSLIMSAVMQHEPHMLQELLNNKVIQGMIAADPITLRDALNHSLKQKCEAIAKLLLNEDTMDVPNTNSLTPLQTAVKHPHIYTLAAFIDNLNFNFRRGRIEIGIALNLMLHKAGLEIDVDYLRRMLSRGARMRYGDFGITAFHVAAELGRTETMAILLEQLSANEVKEDVDRQCSSCHDDWCDKTALGIAAMRGYGDIVRMLLERGAKTEITDDKGETGAGAC